jgi:hypothetical protein
MHSLNSIPGFTPTEAGRAVASPNNGLRTPQSCLYSSQPAYQYSSSQGSVGQSSSRRAENAYYGSSSQPIFNESSSQQASTPSMYHSSQPQSYRSTVFPPTPSSVPSAGRQPLADLSNNLQASQRTPVREPAKKDQAHVPLADGEYLGYYDLEDKYLTHCRDTLDYDDFRKRRRQWLALLDLDVKPYQYIVSISQRPSQPFLSSYPILELGPTLIHTRHDPNRPCH